MSVNGKVILDPTELQSMLGDDRLVVLDARFDIDDESQAAVNFGLGRIPGARQADLGRHMSGEIVPGLTGRRPLPDKPDFGRQVRQWGIHADSAIAIYDDMNGIMAASRLWFMLRWAGFDGAALLDGGFGAWRAAGFDLEDGPEPVVEPSDIEAHFDDDLVCTLSQLEGQVAGGDHRHFDARAGDDGVPSHDPVMGRITGSALCPRSINSVGGRWRDPESLRALYVEALHGVDPADAVYYCGSGVTAAQNLVGLAHAGLPLGRLYVGGFSEWLARHDELIDRIEHI